nr:hypothetical protein [Clostridia bacterium]
MIPRFSCALNGVTPESLDPAIRVTDLTELAPRCRVETLPAGRCGLRLLQRVRESLTVRVHLRIAEYDPARRRTLMAQLHAWAEGGGVLTTSDRPDQQLTVDYAALPALSALTWSDELSVDLTACAVPFWESQEQTSAATSGASSLALPGTAPDCPVGVAVTNNGTSALTTLTLTCGETQMTFSGLQLPASGIFTLHIADGLLRVDAAGESVLMHRSADSSDFLLADGGKATPVSVHADQPVSAVFSGRGRLL